MPKELELPQQEVKGNLLKRYFTQMPIFFPLVGLFLLGLTANEFWIYANDSGYEAIYWLGPVLFLVYTLLWIPICFAKKWAALSFLILSIMGMSYHFFAPDSPLKHAIGGVLVEPLPANVLFSFLILFYFRKMK